MADEIVPDTKNWTWVLERPCLDCGYDGPAFDVAAQTPAAQRGQFGFNNDFAALKQSP